MPNDPINQSADLLLKEKQIEVASKQNTEIEEVIDTIDNDLGFFANSILRLTIGKTKLREILTKNTINSKGDFLDAAFNDNAKLFGSEKLGSAANRIGKKTLEFSNYFSDVFELLQKKNKEILSIIAKYKIELDDLKNDVENKDEDEENDENDENNEEEEEENDKNDNDKNDKNDNPNQEDTKASTYGTGVMAYGTVAGSTLAVARLTKGLNQLNINKNLKQLDLVDINKQKEAMTEIIEELKTRQKRKGFDTPAGLKSRQNIQKTIDHFEQMKKDLSASRRALTDWKNLEKSGLLDAEAFAHFVSHPQSIKNIKNIIKSGKLDDLKSLLKSNPSEAKKLLGIAENVPLPKGFIKSINTIKEIKDLGKIEKVLKGAKVLSRSAKFFKAVPLLDLAFFGLDIWFWDEATSEADNVRKYNKLRAQVLEQQANSHLIVGGISAGLSAALVTTTAILASAGPPGWIVAAVGIAIGATAAAVDHGLDSMYFDIINFYNQNTEDYVKKYRTETKQSIVAIMQSLNPNIDNSLNETVFINEEDVNNKQKNKALIAAYKGLILQEEHIDIQEKSKEKKKIVETRLQYIIKNSNREDIVKLCTSGNINAPAHLLSESKTYEQMMQDTEYVKKNGQQNPNLQSIIAYKAWLSLKLEDENNASYQKLLDMSDLEFFWIAYLVNSKDFSDRDPESIVYKNAKLINKLYTIRSFGKTQEELNAFHSNISSAGYLSLEVFLTQEQITSGLKPVVAYSKEELEDQFINGNTDYYEKISLNDVSNNTSQNVLYRLAKEVHGYTGANTMEDIITFFSAKDKEDSLGLYYDGKWKINDDRGRDGSFDPEIFSDPDLSADYIIDKIYQSDPIDTKTETADDTLNENFRKKFKNILKEERAYIIPENISKVEQNIKTYIEENASSGYIYLPYYLQVQALKAGLGNCEDSFFKYENGKIIEMTPNTSFTTLLSWLHITKPFVDKKETISRPYNKLDKTKQKIFDQEVTKFTSQVDKPLTRIENLIKKDELNIPAEYKNIIHNKISERTSLVTSLKNYNTIEAKKILENNYKSYEKRFDNLYISLLSGIYSNIFVANQDSANVMNQHLSLALSNIVSINPSNHDVTLYFQGRNYAKEGNEDTNIESMTSNDLTKQFFLIYSKVKLSYKGKKITCEDLAKTNLEAAEHYAKIIWRSILELETVDFDIDEYGNMKIDSLNSNLEKGIENHREKIFMTNPFTGLPATLYSFYKDSNKEKNKQLLLSKIMAYNFKNNQYTLPEFDDSSLQS